MLAVGVDPAAIAVTLAKRMTVAGGDHDGQALVLLEPEHLRAVVAGNGGRLVGGAVVDDEDVYLGQLRLQLVEHRGEVLLLVQGRMKTRVSWRLDKVRA